jgi:hypothetical protein
VDGFTDEIRVLMIGIFAGLRAANTENLCTSNGERSSTIFAVENAPTSQPARVNGTHGAGTLSPEGVVKACVLSLVAGIISATLSVQ